METLKDLARDAFVTGVLHDGKAITHYARWGKHVPDWLKLLLEIGDPPEFLGARCPRCGKRYRLQVDHKNPRANGGLTEFHNLGPLCPPCHREKTEEDRRAGKLGPRSERLGNHGEGPTEPPTEDDDSEERAPP